MTSKTHRQYHQIKKLCIWSVLVKLLFSSWEQAPDHIPAVEKASPACAHKPPSTGQQLLDSRGAVLLQEASSASPCI